MDPYPQGLLRGGLFDSDFKDTQECARRQSGSGQVNMEAWELHGGKGKGISFQRPEGRDGSTPAWRPSFPLSEGSRGQEQVAWLTHGDCAERRP